MALETITTAEAEPETEDRSQLESAESASEQLLPNTNIVTHCIYKNDPQRLVKCFDDDTDPYKDEVLELLNTRDADGKSPLDLAACLGRLELTKELLLRGADITACNPKGYSCLHYASAWGRLAVLKVHIENQGNLQQLNIHNERPKEVSLRYHQEACVDFLDWAEAKSLLQEAIRLAQESILDADKAVAGRITKEEKNISLNLCKEKQEWMDGTTDATTQDFISQRLALNEIVTPIIQKLSEPRSSTLNEMLRPNSKEVPKDIIKMLSQSSPRRSRQLSKSTSSKNPSQNDFKNLSKDFSKNSFMGPRDSNV